MQHQYNLKSRWGIGNSFQGKLFFIVAGFILLSSIAFIVFFSYHQYRIQHVALTTEGNLLAGTLANNVRIPVFAANHKQVEESAIGLFTNPKVLSVEVDDTDGHILSWLTRLPPEKPPHEARQRTIVSGQKIGANADFLTFTAPVIGAAGRGENEILFPAPPSSQVGKQLGTVKIMLDKSSMFAQMREIYLIAMLVLIIFLAGGVFSAYMVARKLTRPLRHLIQGVTALESGNMAMSVPVETRDEIGSLAGSFNSMVASLRQRTMDQEAAEQQVLAMNRLLEYKVKQRTKALEESNSELEAFNYSASHDLRGPLGRLQGLCHAFQEDCGNKIDPHLAHYLERITATGLQMKRVVNAMTLLFQVQHRSINPQELNLTDMARLIINELQESEPERTVFFKTEESITAWGDQDLIYIALQNLLGNSWKYTAQCSEAVIEFGIIELAGEKVYCIRDNGIGFDMAYADKLFTPFQRLHSEEEFQGTGVGLAIAHRILNRHQGRIWLESKVNEGTSCYFSLKKNDSEQTQPL